MKEAKTSSKDLVMRKIFRFDGTDGHRMRVFENIYNRRFDKDDEPEVELTRSTLQ